MKKNLPKEFLKEYVQRQDHLKKALSSLVEMMTLRLSQERARNDIRARITEFRVKTATSTWEKARNLKLDTASAFNIEDLLGVRIVCNNLSDMSRVVDMIKREFGRAVVKIKDFNQKPTAVGYRAVHVLMNLDETRVAGAPIPCEIQVRTLAQDTWAQISRHDLYKREVPSLIAGVSKILSDQLAQADATAELIRKELNRPVEAAETIKDSDPITAPRLALLFKEIYGEDLWEWSLIAWREELDRAEAATIGDVRALLSDKPLFETLDEFAVGLRKWGLEGDEWARYSAMVVAEGHRKRGIEAARRHIQAGWDEIVVQSRSGLIPENIEAFVSKLRDDLHTSAKDGGEPMRDELVAMDCFSSCAMCGESIFIGTQDATELILAHYGKKKDKFGLEWLLDKAGYEEASVNNSSLCSHCDHMLNKDD